VTAYEGLRRLGPLAGMRVVVTGASGGVGSAGIVLALALDAAEVVGVVSRPERVEYVRSLGADGAVVAGDDLGAALGRRRVDRVLDTVGGSLFRPCVASLRAGGGLAMVGAVGGADVEFGADALLQPVTITGYGSESLDGPALRAAMTTICTLLAVGELAVPEVTQLPLAEAARAHRLLEEHRITGRILLVPT
jgi:NADPH2:quinone reductase